MTNQSGLSVRLNSFPLRLLVTYLVLGVAFYLLISLFADIDAVLAAISQLPLSLIFFLILLASGNYLARFVRWWFFLHPHEKAISVARHLVIYLAAFALTATPAKAGETVRSLYLKPLGVPYPVSLAAFFAERLLDVAAVSLLALLAVSAVLDTAWLIVVIVPSLLLVIVILRSALLSRFLQRYAGRKLGRSAQEFQQAVCTFLSMGSLLRVLPLSLFAWAMQGVVLWLIVENLAFDLNITLAIGIYSLAILFGAATFIPGGLGATEAAIAITLEGLGMPVAAAVAAALLARLVTLWWAQIIGVLALLRLQATGLTGELARNNSGNSC